jgi:hypothetical protein
VTGISRASALVPDIRSGYFGRLLVSPVSRYSLLLGLMVADLALVIALSMPVLVLGFILGVGFATGPRACSRSCSSAACGASRSPVFRTRSRHAPAARPVDAVRGCCDTTGAVAFSG